MHAQIVYFKESGKFYTSDILELTKEEEHKRQYFNIGDRVINLSSNKQLPGIIGDWLGENGFAIILQEDIGWPMLAKHPSNYLTVPASDRQYQPGKETVHKVELISFKEHGKYNDTENINLDESCIHNGVAVVDRIVDKVSSQKKRRGYYYLICEPKTLSGCPHLLLPTYF